MSTKELRKILLKVRKALENFALSEDSKDFSFHQDPTLAGCCAVGSFVLKEELASVGVSSNVVYCLYDEKDLLSGPYGHCYVEYKGLILDVTISQFIWHKKILIASQGDKIFSKYMMPTNHNDINFDFEYWDDDQRPTTEVVGLIRNKYI
jgi:hypothetical protein